jgi:hypothetical protein
LWNMWLLYEQEKTKWGCINSISWKMEEQLSRLSSNAADFLVAWIYRINF